MAETCKIQIITATNMTYKIKCLTLFVRTLLFKKHKRGEKIFRSWAINIRCNYKKLCKRIHLLLEKYRAVFYTLVHFIKI